MPKTLFAGLLTLALLAGLSPGEAVAGPPERASGKIVVDKVADDILRYRKARSLADRIAWLERMAPTRDPRVAIALWETYVTGAKWWQQDTPSDKRDEKELSYKATFLLYVEFVRGGGPIDGGTLGIGADVGEWWKNNEADLRRRAKQLP
jgi:hypothetical protein